MREALPPWLESAWSRFAAAAGRGRLPHAWLLTGPVGSGKGLLAARMAAGLLCRHGPEPCGRCGECRLVAAGTHPDLVAVAPEQEGRAIGVDAVRELIARLALAPQRGGRRVGLVAPAETMTLAAANALLKTLEEPAPETVLILASARPGRLPATVRSRCVRLAAGPVPAALARDWLAGRVGAGAVEPLLAAAEGGPLAAVALAEEDGLALRDEVLETVAAIRAGTKNPLAVAARWVEDRPRERVLWLRRLVADMIRCRLGAGAAGGGASPRRRAATLPLRWLWMRWDEAGRAAADLEGTANRQLVLETLLLAWARERGDREP